MAPPWPFAHFVAERGRPLRMNRVGVITNPRSHRNRKRLPAIREVLARHPEALQIEIDAKAETAEILREFAFREVDLIVVAGGDGTVQSVMTALLNERMFERPPALAVLPSGMTNLIAVNLGFDGAPETGLARLLDGSRAEASRLARRILSVHQPAWRQPARGMLLGTAGFYRGVMVGRRRIHPLGAEQRLATGLALLASIAQTVLRRSGPDSLYRGERMSIAVDGRVAPQQDYILLLATTLDRLMLGVNPFWGRGKGAVRLTSVSFPPVRFLRALVPLLRGRPRGWMTEQGYASENVHEVRLTTACPIVLDGEILEPDDAAPLIIRADEVLEFVRC